MAIKAMADGGFVITGDDTKNVYRLLALKGALKLEIAGMKGRGRTAYAVIKEEYGLTGNKASVLTQFENILRVKGILKP